jgi:tetratricopeptide (TPR) repeat protein
MIELFTPHRSLLQQAGIALGLSLLILQSAVALPPTTLQEIQQMIQAGELDGARTHLMEILSTTPDDPVALNLLGVVNAQEGQFRAAEHCYRKAIAAAPDFVGAYLNLGRLYQENERRDPRALKESLAAYESALKVDPSNLEANYQAAFVSWRAGLFQPSLDRLSHLPEAARQRPQALALICADHASMKNTRLAQEACDRLLQQPDLVEADVITVVPALLAQRQNDIVIRLLAGLDLRGLASPKTQHQLGLLYEQQGELNAARTTLEKLTQNQGAVPASLLNELARVAYKEKDLDSALGYLAHARELDPENPGIQFFFGMVCLEKGYLAEAYLSLRRAAEMNPENAYYNYAAGAVMMSRRDVREGYPYLKKYCQLKPGDPRGHLALGAAYFYGNDPDLALKEIKGVADSPETAAAAHYFLGRLANQQGRFSEAVRDLQEAIRVDPVFAEAYAELGFSLVKMKQDAEAEKDLRKALEINPQSYTANLSLMMLYERTKDPRTSEQVNRFNQIREVGEQREKEFLRTIEVRPF